ncbi:MAG: ABC-F family ATP-binding cassette domain-containing protein [Lachnospiraceae bacterium]|nr:ABC-F family ATP-binding cassette domain-containing protein [Lachnospiraceae bacterium]
MLASQEELLYNNGMLLSCQNISKAFSEKTILENVSFNIEDNDKAAVVGINGAGKTTLLRIIAGEIQPDHGQAVLAKEKTFDYLKQNHALSGDRPIIDELFSVKTNLIDLELKIRSTELLMNKAHGKELEQLLETYARLNHDFEFAGGYAYRSEVTGILKGLGFDEQDFKKPINILSGGQKTRVALGKLLLNKPDLILLDEPTNHLDLASINWLEAYLKNYQGAVLIVSHDRYFLDRIVEKTIEISSHKALLFRGNYTAYAAQKQKLKADEMKAYLNQQQEVKRQEAVIAKLRQFNREKHIKRAKSREKQLAKIELNAKPIDELNEIRFAIKPAVTSGNDVLLVSLLAKSFGSHLLFKDVDFNIRRGEHVAILGDNGTGKTTLLKILNQSLPADSGQLKLGTNVNLAYYDQEQLLLDEEKTLMMEISDAYPELSDTQIRNMLAAFLFLGDDVFKQIKDLSGGERGRLSLAKLMLSQANFLLLDEPTNHLDIISKEVLENALKCYSGTILYVSHDRYFINQTATRILHLANGRFVDYPGYGSGGGIYDYFLEKKDAKEALGEQPISDKPKDTTSAAKENYLSRKEKQSAERKHESQIKRCEEKIAALETKLKDIDNEMLLPGVVTNADELMRLEAIKENTGGELNALYDEWEMLTAQVHQ